MVFEKIVDGRLEKSEPRRKSYYPASQMTKGRGKNVVGEKREGEEKVAWFFEVEEVGEIDMRPSRF